LFEEGEALLKQERENEEAEEHVDSCTDLGFASSKVLAFFPFPNRELRKVLSLPPGEMGCFTFFRLLYIFNALDFDFIRRSSLLADVINGFGLEGAKHETRDLDPYRDSVSEEDSNPELESEQLEVELKNITSRS